MAIPVIVLPELQGIANECDDFFTPDDCDRHGITIRRGRIWQNNFDTGRHVVDAVLGWMPSSGICGLMLIIRPTGGDWRIHTGGTARDELLDAFQHVCGWRPVWD